MANVDSNTIVVGAGMAGLYFGMYAVQSGTVTVTILERLSRTGGRLDTDVVQINGEWVKNEEGGMRFTKEMTHLMSLLKTLGLDSDILPFGMGSDSNIYNLRGRKFTFVRQK